MFEEFVQILNDMGRSIHAYQQCAARAHEKAGSDTDCAAAYLLIALAAETFVTRNERMPLPADVAQAAYEEFVALVSLLDKAQADGTPEQMLAALNRTAHSIAGDH